MDGWTNGQNNGKTDRYIDGQSNEWMDMHREAKINDFPIDSAIFTKASRTD